MFGKKPKLSKDRDGRWVREGDKIIAKYGTHGDQLYFGEALYVVDEKLIIATSDKELVLLPGEYLRWR